MSWVACWYAVYMATPFWNMLCIWWHHSEICCVYGDTILKYKKYVHVCGCLCVYVRAIPKHSLELGNGTINQPCKIKCLLHVPTGFNFKNSTLFPKNVLTCFVRISEQTVTISPYSINSHFLQLRRSVFTARYGMYLYT
jgi:hypothetical protein